MFEVTNLCFVCGNEMFACDLRHRLLFLITLVYSYASRSAAASPSHAMVLRKASLSSRLTQQSQYYSAANVISK